MNKRDKKYLIKSKCKFCGEEILKYNKNSKDYCEIHKVNCYICGKEFILKRRYLNEETVLRNKFCCSVKCRNIEISQREDRNYKESIKKGRETLINKYGVDNPLKIEEIKIKVQNTRNKKYGKEYFSTKSKEMWNNRTKEEKENIINKLQKTKENKYGNKTYSNPEKAKETMIKNYGEKGFRKIKSNAMNTMWNNKTKEQRKEISEKSKKTIYQLYGNDYYKNKAKEIWRNRTKEEKENIINKSQKTRKRKYKIDPFYNSAKKNYKIISKINLKFKKLLEDNNITLNLEYKVKEMLYDFYLDNYNILIEINPYAFHNCTWAPKGLPKTKEYHLNKTKSTACFDLINF